MRIPRIYTPQQLEIGRLIQLDSTAGHHITRVLRLSPGAALHLFNGQSGDYLSHIAAITKQHVSVTVDELLAVQRESCLSIHLGQAISRGERMDITMQKATELGVTEITPLLSDFCQVKLPPDRLEKKMQHWHGIIIHACEQSGRTIPPVLHPPCLASQWVETVQATYKLTLEPHAGISLKALPLTENLSFSLLIGSEGGLSKKECELANTYGFRDIQLGPRVLRTETAALAVISALQTLFGDF